MTESYRATAREIARQYLKIGDPLGWFEELYATAQGDASIIPWADLRPNPNLLAWLDENSVQGQCKNALKVGCGLGDDAEELERRGFDTTAFDISLTAIKWCRKRFPNSSVHYTAADLFKAPHEWMGGFDFILESYTLQVLPLRLRSRAAAEIAGFVKPGGTLLVICRGRDHDDSEGKMPWPLTRQDLYPFKAHGLKEITFEDYSDKEDPPVRRFRVTYSKPVK
jgi:SAM-dependent methyltransferase